jgi:GR25 family glycosyltransferase involved in LPS biosynthesis
MDKNKSAYKLKGFGPLYVINLDDQPERWAWMEDQLKYWEIEDYTRISAYDGRPDVGSDLSEIIQGRYPEQVSSGEIGCLTSHLKAIKHFYEETDAPYAIMMEDDCDISIARFWTFTWRQFMSRVPYDWDVVQVAIICPGELHVNIHRRFINDFSTACYVITRHHAKKLIDLHCRGEKYKLDNGVKPRPVADDLIYNSGASYACPIFLYKIELGSSIHPEHIEIFHRGSHNGLRELWETRGSDITIDMISDFDPYLGRVAGRDQVQQQELQSPAMA